jgi:hypothetical protein
MVSKVEANFLMKCNRSLVGAAQPEQVMKPKASVCPARIPRIEPSRHVYPVKLQVLAPVLCKISLNGISVMSMSKNPNLMPARKLTGPIPCKAGFRTLARAASVANEQYLHDRHRLPCTAITFWMGDDLSPSSNSLRSAPPANEKNL